MPEPVERAVACGQCGRPMVLRRINGDLFYGCTGYPECTATHGAHPDGRPLGIPGDHATRQARIKAHAALDPLWKNAPRLYELSADPAERVAEIRRLQLIARVRAYNWLGEVLNLSKEATHIGNMDVFTCELVVRACQGMTADQLRAWARAKELERADR